MNEHEPHKELIPIGEHGMELTNFDQLWRVATLLQKSGLVATSFKTPEQLMVALLRAIELKLPPLQAIEGMTVIQNRVGLMGDLALSMVEGSGLLEKKTVTYSGQGDSLSCTITLKRKGRDKQDYSFSVIEAKEAGIYARSAVWRSYPRRMTYYRALGFGLRDEFADVLKGIKTIEELQDYPDAPVPDYDVSEAKVADNQKKQEELLKTKGVKIVEMKQDKPRPAPEEALEPAFDEDKVEPVQSAPAFAQRLATDYPQHPAAVAAAAEPDDLDMGPRPPMPESPPPQEAQTAASQPPGDGVEAPIAAWKEHIILGVAHPKFSKRKVGDLNAAELGIIEAQWLPKVREQWDDATDAQRADATAFESAIAFSKMQKPW